MVDGGRIFTVGAGAIMPPLASAVPAPLSISVDTESGVDAAASDAGVVGSVTGAPCD